MRPPSSLACWLWLLSQLAPTAARPTASCRGHAPRGSRGAVASESSICSKIGIHTIAIGGTAADAMVATTLCVGTIGMYHSGIGGGGFMLVRDKDGNYETIDYRETAPAAAAQDMYKHDANASVVGGLAVAVPGELRGLEYLHRKYGVLPWRELVMPSVHLARYGFEVNEDLVRYMKSATEDGNFLVDDPIWAEDFAPNGKLLQLGDTITRKRFADSLEKIAHQGPDVFYEGEIAKSIIDFIQKMNGIMTLEDLRNYKVEVKPPLSVTFGDYRLFTTQAPSSGAVLLNMLKTMDQFPAEDLDNVRLTTHRFVEAMKFAYGARAELGDPAFLGNMTEYQSRMISDETAQQTRGRILDNQTQPVDAYNPQALYATESHGTSHIVAADASGLTVTSTTTINLLFGAKIMTPDTGIILNNEMDDFSQPNRNNSFGYAPSPANYIAPGKRPLSSISPLVAEHACNGTVQLATGAAGGSRITSSTAQVAWHVLTGGLGLRDAIAAPRLHHQLMPDALQLEHAFDNRTAAALAARGHAVEWVAPGRSAVQGLARAWDGRFDAVGETRQVNSGGFTI